MSYLSLIIPYVSSTYGRRRYAYTSRSRNRDREAKKDPTKWTRRVHFAFSITLSSEPTLPARPYFCATHHPPATLADLAPAAPAAPATSIASSEPHEFGSASSAKSGTRAPVDDCQWMQRRAAAWPWASGLFQEETTL